MRTPDELKAQAMKFFDYFNAQNFEGLDKEVIGEEYIQHSPGVPPQRSAIITYISQTLKAYPDGRFIIDDMIAEGDKVLIRWTFIGRQTQPFGRFPASNREITITGMDLWQMNEQGKIAEAWFYMDMSAVMPNGNWQRQPVSTPVTSN